MFFRNKKKGEHKEDAVNQPIELGTIHYRNLTHDGRHGDYQAALDAANDKPLFCNFAEWSG